MLRPLRHRDFRVLLSSLAVSATGDWLYSVALLVFVFEATGSATWVAVTTVARLLPFVLLGAIGGALADRHERRRVMVTADLVRAAVMFVMAAVVLSSGPVAFAVVLAVTATVASTPYRPAVDAATPAILREDDLASGNALRETVEGLALLAGPALGGLLLTVVSPGTVILLNGVTFLLSAALIARLQPLPSSGTHEAAPSLAQRLAEGFTAIRSEPGITAVVTVIAAATFLYGMTSVLYVVVAEQLLGMGSQGYGYLLAAAGAGGLMAVSFTRRLVDGGNAGRALLAAGVLLAVPSVTLAITRDPIVALLVLLLEGGAGVVIDVVAVTLMQRLVDQAVLGRVFGVLDSVAASGMLLGSFAAPLAVTVVGLPGALVFCGTATVAAVAAVAGRLLAMGRMADTRAAQLADAIRLVERTRIFEGAPRSAVEGVAASLQARDVAAGEAVVSEGEPADALYVIETGTFDVVSGGPAGGPGVTINELGGGDYFGEIGLLERIPRTATVRCTQAGRIHRLDGEEFLLRAQQAPTGFGRMRAGAAARLARTHPGYAVTGP